jgi:hypothetical protein
MWPAKAKDGNARLMVSRTLPFANLSIFKLKLYRYEIT